MKISDISINCIVKTKEQKLGFLNLERILAFKCFECQELIDKSSYDKWKDEKKQIDGTEGDILEYLKTLHWKAKLQGIKWIFLCPKSKVK